MESRDLIARTLCSQRILVLGSSGSGKTTFSIQLGRILDIPTIHLDAQFWKPGWIATPQVQWRQRVAELIRQASWIMDGTYESTLDLRVPAAETIILIENSRWVCLWRTIKRKATWQDHHRPDAPPGQKLDRGFLRYVWQYPTVTRPVVLGCLRQYGREKTTVQLRGSDATRRFLRQIRQAAQRKLA